MEGVQAKPEKKQERKPSLAEKKQEREPSLKQEREASLAEKKQEKKLERKPSLKQEKKQERKPSLAEKKQEKKQEREPSLKQKKQERKPSLAEKKQEREPSLAEKKQEKKQEREPSLAEKKQEKKQERKPSLAEKKQEREPSLKQEPKPSLAKKKQVVPNDINATKPTRVLETDWEDDKDLAARLRTGAEEFKHSKGFDLLKNFLMYMTLPNEMIASEISACHQKILKAKGQKKAMEAYEEYFEDLVKEYRQNNWGMQELCAIELQNFINSARDFADVERADVVRDRQKKLRKAKGKYLQCARAVVKKAESLQNKHAATHDKLKEQVQKLDKKLALRRTLKRVLNVMLIGTLAAFFVCTIMAATMAASPVASALTAHPLIAGLVAGGAAAYPFSPVFKKGRDCLLTFSQGYEEILEAYKGLMKSMEARTGHAIKELDGIRRLVNKVSRKGKGTLADFDREIKELEEITKACQKNLKKSLEQVNNEYDDLKMKLCGIKSDVWNKIK